MVVVVSVEGVVADLKWIKRTAVLRQRPFVAMPESS